MLEHSYAKALERSVTAGKSPKEAVSALHAILERRGRLALFPRIARAFTRIAQQGKEKNTITLSVAPSHAIHANKEAKDVLTSLKIDAEEMETKTDETLIGGWRLEGREHLYDASFKKHLLSIYNRITR